MKIILHTSKHTFKSTHMQAHTPQYILGHINPPPPTYSSYQIQLMAEHKYVWCHDKMSRMKSYFDKNGVSGLIYILLEVFLGTFCKAVFQN